MIYFRKGLPLLTGDTPEQRHEYLRRHTSDSERRQMVARRAERIAWLGKFNPEALPPALRGFTVGDDGEEAA